MLKDTQKMLKGVIAFNAQMVHRININLGNVLSNMVSLLRVHAE